MISIGNGDHWNLTVWSLEFEICVERMDLFLLFDNRFVWLIRNIDVEPLPEISVNFRVVVS